MRGEEQSACFEPRGDGVGGERCTLGLIFECREEDVQPPIHLAHLPSRRPEFTINSSLLRLVCAEWCVCVCTHGEKKKEKKKKT